MGKPGLLGGCWVNPSHTFSWNRHYALWITNNTIVFINLVSSSNTSFSQTIIQQSWYSYPKYNNTKIIWLLTNWSLDCILPNNCRQFSWRHKGDWNCRWIIGFIDRLALWLQFWGNRFRYVWCHNPLRTPHSRTMSVLSLIIPSRIMGVRNQCLKIRFAMGNRKITSSKRFKQCSS